MSSFSSPNTTASVQLAELTFMLLATAVAIAATMDSVLSSSNSGANLDERVKQLSELMEPVIKIDADKFRRFIGGQSVPRNYSFILMMTALSPYRDCHICWQANEEFTIVAASFKNSPHFGAKRLFFGSVDFDKCPDVFRELNIASVPCLLYFDENGAYMVPEELDIQRLGTGADVIARWIAEKTGMTIKIDKPRNLTIPIMMGAFALTLFAILYLTRSSFDFLFDRNTWAFSSVAMVSLMTSGQMWNQIRGAPLIKRSRSQNIFIQGSSNSQFVIESYLVMIMNTGIAIGIVLVTDALRKVDKQQRTFTVRAGVFMIILSFSLLLFMFRQKSPSYPYRLLF